MLAAAMATISGAPLSVSSSFSEQRSGFFEKSGLNVLLKTFPCDTEFGPSQMDRDTGRFGGCKRLLQMRDLFFARGNGSSGKMPRCPVSIFKALKNARV